MVATATVLLATHVAEVFLWAATYAVLQVIPVETEAIYFAFVNYTTLGYGDILPAAEWRLLGPMAAMNGILLFGWSTAVIFEVLRHAMLLHGQTGPEPR
ncbi:potassium channel family protein [Chelatococcus asaccharovorans]